ncbi:hemolysin XhlA family protein [Arthrobacter sp. UM1]|uniref:hemolysin XhlA family protein n=1 Tax=Arthrobacter sp. UM1 TaxID=2766776 RepID=UPI001CF6F5DC|nr:hemolysin XhlA family protein [Arthrobacter sp. UM1]MCB4209156.1 hypothetical protein [Arthrobacter sp. UM1]
MVADDTSLDDITLGEVVRRLDRIETKLDTAHPTKAEFRGEVQPLRDRVQRLESAQTWIARLIGTGLVGLVIDVAVRLGSR